jgi:hypothetical protein
MYKAARSDTLNNFQILISLLSVRAVSCTSQVQVLICLGGVEFYHDY